MRPSICDLGWSIPNTTHTHTSLVWERVLYISITLNYWDVAGLLGILWLGALVILVNVPHGLEKNVYSAGWNTLQMLIRYKSHSFHCRHCFCAYRTYQLPREQCLHLQLLIVDLSISFCNSLSFDSRVFLLGVYRLTTVMSS